MNISDNSTLLMIGDSITDCSRARPVGEGLGEALGRGYVSLIDAHLNAALPRSSIRIINMGNSGDTVRSLKSRWQTDVVALKPDYLSIMIGINDVWRHFDTPLMTETLVDIEEYGQTLDRLMREVLPLTKGLFVLSPYVLEKNRQDEMRVMVDAYGAIARKAAGLHNAIFIDTQAAFDAVLEHVHPTRLAWDRIHVTLTGHMIIARAFLDAIAAL